MSEAFEKLSACNQGWKSSMFDFQNIRRLGAILFLSIWLNIISLGIPIIWKVVFLKNSGEPGQGVYWWESLTQLGGILTRMLAGKAVSLPAVPEHTNKYNLTEFVLTEIQEVRPVAYSWQVTWRQ